MPNIFETPSPTRAQFIFDLLSLTAEYDVNHALAWTQDLTGFYFGCNDCFAWACADAEDIEPGDLPAIRQALEDEKAAKDRPYADSDGVLLWIARKRQLRPQGALYQHIDSRMWPLFDACGPAREVDVINPVDRATLTPKPCSTSPSPLPPTEPAPSPAT